ncbi:hypothetical protein [Niabella aurantiaca]|uniref:hypothetical protein n=1 Tax=Niabella aurantiaca TaxID=379900 RepID=UPI00035E47CC|nr:hypothetical protein [Niabella aurantiaca]
MIMLFPTIKVPGLDDIEIFRDHEKSDTFYALRGRPRIAEDDKGTPQLSFNFFSRNADIAYASSANKELVETQLGQLLFTTDLSISAEEHKTITDYLEKMLDNKNHLFVRLYSKLGGGKKTVAPAAAKPVIKLGTPNTWKDGVAKLEILEGLGDTFKKQSSGEVKPALVGSNAAAFYATFGIEGAQLMFDALTKGYEGDKEKDNITPLQAIVRYDLKGFAFIPNLEIKVTANSTQIFDQMQSYQTDYSKKRRGGIKTEIGFFSYKRTDTRSVSASKTEIARMIQTLIDRKVINIEITDFGDVAANSEEIKEIENSLRTSLLDMIMQTIIPNFFQTAFIGDSNPPAEGTTATDGQPHPNPDTGVTAAERDRPNVEEHYYFRNDVDKTKITSLNFHFKKNGTVEFRRYPNGTLTTNLSQEELKALVQEIDISSPRVQILELQIGVNADFAADNIHSIIVNVSYKQQDSASKQVRENSKSYLFKTGQEIYTFRVTMARNEKGELIDFYTAEAKISYIGTAEAPPPIRLENISDRSLVVSYDKLGFVTVNCIAGDIDWTLIKEAIVQLVYTAAPDQPDTKKEIRLTKDAPTGNWRCYTYGKKDKSYSYKVKYLYSDGREIESEEKSDTKGTLMIDDLLTGRVKASFDVIMDTNTVKTAKVEILYEDAAKGIKEEYSHWFNGSETWDWSARTQQGAGSAFKYRYFVQYQDGIVFTSPWQDSESDNDIPPITLGRKQKTLTIDGGLLDWTKWQVVYVSVEYNEPDHNYRASKNIRIDANAPLQSFEVMPFANDSVPFLYSLQFAKAGAAPVSVAQKENTTGLLLLEDPVAPPVQP